MAMTASDTTLDALLYECNRHALLRDQADVKEARIEELSKRLAEAQEIHRIQSSL